MALLSPERSRARLDPPPLPWLNGFAVARLAAESWPHLAIVVYSGRVKTRAGDMPAGAVFLERPSATPNLFASAREALATKGSALLGSGRLLL